MCTHIYVVNICIYIDECICKYIHIYIHIHACIHTCIYTHICVHWYMYLQVPMISEKKWLSLEGLKDSVLAAYMLRICMYTYIYIHIYIYVYIHTHTHIYTYTYIYIHTYIHTYTNLHVQVPRVVDKKMLLWALKALCAMHVRYIYTCTHTHTYIYINICTYCIYMCIYIYI